MEELTAVFRKHCGERPVSTALLHDLLVHPGIGMSEDQVEESLELLDPQGLGEIGQDALLTWLYSHPGARGAAVGDGLPALQQRSNSGLHAADMYSKREALIEIVQRGDVRLIRG
eukprot:5368531-Amphidinium_carterae.1